jgi:hypothetical protein
MSPPPSTLIPSTSSSQTATPRLPSSTASFNTSMASAVAQPQFPNNHLTSLNLPFLRSSAPPPSSHPLRPPSVQQTYSYSQSHSHSLSGKSKSHRYPSSNVTSASLNSVPSLTERMLQSRDQGPLLNSPSGTEMPPSQVSGEIPRWINGSERSGETVKGFGIDWKSKSEGSTSTQRKEGSKDKDRKKRDKDKDDRKMSTLSPSTNLSPLPISPISPTSDAPVSISKRPPLIKVKKGLLSLIGGDKSNKRRSKEIDEGLGVGIQPISGGTVMMEEEGAEIPSFGGIAPESIEGRKTLAPPFNPLSHEFNSFHIPQSIPQSSSVSLQRNVNQTVSPANLTSVNFQSFSSVAPTPISFQSPGVDGPTGFAPMDLAGNSSTLYDAGPFGNNGQDLAEPVDLGIRIDEEGDGSAVWDKNHGIYHWISEVQSESGRDIVDDTMDWGRDDGRKEETDKKETGTDGEKDFK